ncbi:2-oxo-4-hydroxy-4-carboxy-5-ureidoimidazoline decarboxylase [Herbidospora sp. NEAU-GS84]|uniref:2-oxo-4-hydroxy-4-carboxy-5-ureidoimidazoline decarboxylase n=1 Tax=Herbidospora solisilvae TaxID=2696284 RepID=A0A7C9JCB1_9ACTN|nr:2-oxo-4-hydroxy-4-carboxy-5-ureidoimidazoline decarboxylase [Herbidospora solisilvae]NAS22761.1 2-oxo-4-hydroxy-4-carboxy-5-ureidoimidazoline decarboxylase [Herbidospora solisilvae]
MREPSRDDLLACCASARWADGVAGRPYADLAALLDRSDAVLAMLNWADVEEALAAHPRIGDRSGGGSRESAWSREEQSGTAAAEEDVLRRLRAGNAAYEERFGHVYLVCATGKSAPEMLAILEDRLGNVPEKERMVVRDELGKIVRLRLAKLWEEDA